MAVHRVPARIAGAADEPASVQAGPRVEHACWPLIPIDRLCGLAPIAFRVALREVIGFVVSAEAGIHGVIPGCCAATAVPRFAIGFGQRGAGSWGLFPHHFCQFSEVRANGQDTRYEADASACLALRI